MYCKCPPNSVLIVTPWLEGGGAQKALAALMLRNAETHFHVVTLFQGCKNYAEVEDLSDDFTLLDHPRNPLGTLKASRAVGGLFERHNRVYSLLRGSHVVLGLRPKVVPAGTITAATIHQMPSSEGSGLRARIEELLLKRFTSRANLVTSPSQRAVAEAIDRRYADASNTFYEANLLPSQSTEKVAPRLDDNLEDVRLLFAGRLTRQKGLDLIPDLLSSVSGPVTLRILGDGPERSSLQGLLEDFSPKVTVEMLPYTPNVATHIDWSDAVFMPSRSELNPVFIHEAWMRGRPAIVSNIAAFRDLADQGPLYIAANSHEYTQLISQIAENVEVRKDAFLHAGNKNEHAGHLDRFLSQHY